MSPLVTVVIATKDRADLLPSSIHSVLNQTMEDLELIVVDDGSTDNTKAIVEAYTDPRVHYATTGPVSRGISAARNVGTELARGEWIAVHDDDDFMMPDRLERQLAHDDGDVDFIFGAFVNFDDESGELQLHHGRNYSYGAALGTGFAPGHSTWLVKTSVMRQFPYDEGLESAVDNNLAFRLLRTGIQFRHSGEIVLLRRVHNRRITSTGGSKQKYAADLNLQFLRHGIDEQAIKRMWKEARYDWGALDKASWQRRILPYLPDHLVRRGGVLVFPEGRERNGRDVLRVVDASDLSWGELYRRIQEGASGRYLCARYREDDCIESKLKAPSLFDVGADINLISTYFSNKSKDNNRVVAFQLASKTKSHSAVLSHGIKFIFGESEIEIDYGFFETVSELSERIENSEIDPMKLTIFSPVGVSEGS